MKKLTVIEALAINAAGWHEDWQHALYLQARGVLYNAAQQVYNEHREPLPAKTPIEWLPDAPSGSVET